LGAHARVATREPRRRRICTERPVRLPLDAVQRLLIGRRGALLGLTGFVAALGGAAHRREDGRGEDDEAACQQDALEPARGCVLRREHDVGPPETSPLGAGCDTDEARYDVTGMALSTRAAPGGQSYARSQRSRSTHFSPANVDRTVTTNCCQRGTAP